MDKINPCYFCGSTHMSFSSTGMSDTGADLPYAECSDCGASGPVMESRDEAVRAWNRAVMTNDAES